MDRYPGLESNHTSRRQIDLALRNKNSCRKSIETIVKMHQEACFGPLVQALEETLMYVASTEIDVKPTLVLDKMCYNYYYVFVGHKKWDLRPTRYLAFVHAA